jgi:hypothetical protein
MSDADTGKKDTEPERVMGLKAAIINGVIVAVVTGAWGVYFAEAVRDIRDWWSPDAVGKAPAVVVASCVLTAQRYNHHQELYTVYRPHVQFQYEVDGVTYERDNEATSEWDRLEYPAEEAVLEYPEGHRFTVYYHLDDPTNVYISLESKSRGSMVWFLVKVLLFAPLVVAAVVWYVVNLVRAVRKRLAARQVPS